MSTDADETVSLIGSDKVQGKHHPLQWNMGRVQSSTG